MAASKPDVTNAIQTFPYDGVPTRHADLWSDARNGLMVWLTFSGHVAGARVDWRGVVVDRAVDAGGPRLTVADRFLITVQWRNRLCSSIASLAVTGSARAVPIAENRVASQ